MALFVYAPTIRKGTNELMEALDAKRLTRFDGMRFVNKGHPIDFDQKEDVVICWGACVPPIGKMRIFNKSLHFSTALQANKSLQNTRFSARGWMLGDLHPASSNVTIPTSGGEYYVNDYNLGNVVPQRDYPGHVQTYYTMKHEYELVMLGTTPMQATQKTTSRKIHNPDYTYDPATMAHKWYRSEATGWKPTALDLKKIPTVSGIIARFMAKTELDFAVVSVGCSEPDGYNGGGYNYNIIRKLDLAPTLDTPETVDGMVSIIKTWMAGGKG